MAFSYQDRLDLDRETAELVAGLAAMSSGIFGSILHRLGVEKDVLERMRSAQGEYAALVNAPEQVAEHLAPLGWIAFGEMPVDEYRAAAALAAAGEADAAEELLVAAWEEDDRLRFFLTRLVKTAYPEELSAICHRRWHLLNEVCDNHADGRFASAIALALTQIDGVVFDMTGREAKSFFATGCKARHLQDETTFAGHPNGLQVLARLFTKDRNRTVVDGELRRHGILHGRELGFDDRRNSVKTLVALAAVLEWAAPFGRAEADRLAREREERWAGSRERDEFGRLRDRRGFSQAKQALMTLATYQHGYFTRHGCYAASVEDLDQGGRLPRDIVIQVAEGSGSYRAWTSTPPGLVFGIAGAEGEFVGWQYVGDAEPPRDIHTSDEWRHDATDPSHPDW